jgi:methylenetetrahydrofolate dehydrogenase (NADP+)/methenyltetrahydrofolate cyclohydrolase
MIFNCKKLAEREAKKLKKNLNKKLSLGVVQIGEDEISKVYIRVKRKAAEEAGIDFNYYKFSSQALFGDIWDQIKEMKDDGLIIQLPIEGNLDSQQVLNLVPFKKDVDVLSEASLGKFFSGRLDILPPTVGAVDKILKEKEVDLKGKVVAIVGQGRLVGKPLATYALEKKATVISINSSTKNPKNLIQKADLIITGVGKPKFIDDTFIKKGASIIDAGTCKVKGKTIGDVNTELVEKKANFVTPVPGGVGPLTVVSLLENLVKRYAD